MRTLFGTQASGQRGGVGNVAITYMAGISDSTDGTSWGTGTYTPGGSSRLVLIAVMHSGSAALAAANAPTGSSISGAGLVTSLLLATNIRRLDLWSALSTGTPGAITVTFPATNTGASLAVHECTGVDTAAGTRGVVQNATGNGNGVTAMTLTLGAFASANNATFACWGNGDAVSATPKAGWTELRDSAYTVPATGLETEWIATSDTNPTATASSATQYVGIGIEIAST